MLKRIARPFCTVVLAMSVLGSTFGKTVGPADPGSEPNAGMVGSAPVYYLYDTSDIPLEVMTTSFIAQSVSLDSSPATLRTFTFSALAADPDTLFLVVNGAQVTSVVENRVSDWSWYSFDLSTLPVVESGSVNVEIRNASSSPISVVLVPWLAPATYRRIDALNGSITQDIAQPLPGGVNFQLTYETPPVPEPSSLLLMLIGAAAVLALRRAV